MLALTSHNTTYNEGAYQLGIACFFQIFVGMFCYLLPKERYKQLPINIIFLGTSIFTLTIQTKIIFEFDVIGFLIPLGGSLMIIGFIMLLFTELRYER